VCNGAIVSLPGAPATPAHIHDPSQHLDKSARHRQVRPAHIGADMEQDKHSLAEMLAGDERRSIFQRGPALGRQHRIRLGQHLAAHRDILRY
jgi:hypothetical protein